MHVCKQYNKFSSIKVCDLIDAPGTSERFWESLAERRRLALKNALEENKELVEKLNRSEERNKKLQEEKRVYKEMYDETVALVEVLQVCVHKY